MKGFIFGILRYPFREVPPRKGHHTAGSVLKLIRLTKIFTFVVALFSSSR